MKKSSKIDQKFSVLLRTLFSKYLSESNHFKEKLHTSHAYTVRIFYSFDDLTARSVMAGLGRAGLVWFFTIDFSVV